MNRLSTVGALALLAIATAGCDTAGIAYGDVNAIIAVMSPELWSEVQDDVYEALEPTVRTVRNEKTFTVTYQEPFAEHWIDLRRFRQILIVGSANDPVIVEALDRAGEQISQLGMHQIGDVWARGQAITLVLLPEGGGAEDLRPHLAEVNELLDGQYRRWVLNRMYMSGRDSALADTLSAEAGFALIVPEVYRWSSSDSVYVFRNDNPDPAELIREVAVTWRTPIPPDLQAEDILEAGRRLLLGATGERAGQRGGRSHGVPRTLRVPNPRRVDESSGPRLACGRPVHYARRGVREPEPHVPGRLLALRAR